MKYLVAVFSLAVIAFYLNLPSHVIGAGENSAIVAHEASFPEIVGANLQGEKQILPQAFTDKMNIVAIAFKREQQDDVDSWITPINEMINNYNVSFYELPVIYESTAFSRWWINNGMRRGIPGEVDRKRTITIYTDREKFFQIMKMKEDQIYVLVVNNKGKILWQADGRADEEKLTSLRNIIRSK